VWDMLGGSCFVTPGSLPCSGGFLTSCEAELQELMKQIDIMVAHKKSEWEGQTQALEACLSARERELSSTKAALQEKQKEVGMLRRQLEDVEKSKQDMVREYEQQLEKFQEELSRLRRSYEKLQRKKTRSRGEANKGQEEDKFELSRLTRKLEEFRQKSLDWEKQRLQYQQQVASLEAQRKALAEHSELVQSQLAKGKQILGSVELVSSWEIQPSARLERANDTSCARELERLSMRLGDLSEDNRIILEDQQRVQEELRQSKKMLEALQDEKMELRATLQSQEDLIDSSKLHQEQLQKELARMTETLHTKECLIRALEERLQGKPLSPAGLGLEQVLLQLDVAQKKEQHLQSEVTRLENSLLSSNARCVQLSEELGENIKELQSLEEDQTESRAEIKKLKEQLSQAEHMHSSELEGMKREISRLTQELHQRDITIASASGSTSDLERQLRAEIERAERKAVEHRVILVQLETLKLENRHLSEVLEKTECAKLKGDNGTLRALREDYAVELQKLISENQQLRKDLTETRAKLGVTAQGQGKEPRDVQHRTAQEAQQEQDEHTEGTHLQPDSTAQHLHRDSQKCGAAETGTVTPEMGEPPSQSSSKNCKESRAQLAVESVLHVVDENKDFADEASKQPASSHHRESVFLCPLPAASVGSIAARYLEDEEVRSQHILECLNAHIEELKKESAKIVRRFDHQE
ncbi:CEP63 protein, partial [Cettia cetti]|nr:CEP63 protein [Cettia cetti]